MHRKFFTFLFILCFGIALPAFAKPLPVFVSILPQQYFVERIGEEHVMVQAMVQPGASPATYEPKPQQMARLSEAALYFSIGVPFEKAWLPRFADANAQLTFVSMDEGIHKLAMRAHHHHEEHGEHEDGHKGHGDEHEHGHGHQTPSMHTQLDPHVWLSPMLAKHMATQVKNALVKADPEHAGIFRKNLRTLKKEIDLLDVEIHTLFANIPEEKRKFMVFHPSWGYFAMNYQLEQLPIEYEGKEPSPRVLAELIEEAKDESIATIFVQPQFTQKSAQAIARHIGAKLIIADPLAKDWANNLRAVAKKFATALQQ